MAIFGWSELVLILVLLLFLGVPVLIAYYITKDDVSERVAHVLEALEEKGPSAQATTKLCQECGRGVVEEAKFCPHCGTQSETG